MKICVVIPPAPGLYDPKTNVPLGPLYVASVLEKAGHEVVMVSLLGHDIPAVWPEADLYAMGFTTPQAGVAKGVMELIRGQHPGALVLAGGAHPSALPMQTLQMGFDSVLVGEAEKTILQVVFDLPDLKAIYQGVSCDDLDEIPFPARHLLPSEDMLNEATTVFMQERKEGHVAAIMSSRGCPGKCAFCSNKRQVSRYRSAENVVAEMRMLVDLGITNFKFQDDTFTLSPRHVIALGEEAEKAFDPGQTAVRVITRVDTFSERLVPALRKLNTEIVSFGIESGSQEILDISRKGITIEKVERALSLVHDNGLRTFGYFMFGLPGECERSIDETYSFLRRNRSLLDTAVLSFFVPYPGSDIAARPEHYRVHILEHDWNRYWTVQKRTVMALPYATSFDKMMELKDRMISMFTELGYARPEWKNDL